MKTANTEAWGRFLLTTDKRQGTAYLAYGYPENVTYYCCLGIGCTMTPGIRRSTPDFRGVIAFGNERRTPPDEFLHWLGFPPKEGGYSIHQRDLIIGDGYSFEARNKLSLLNDTGIRFPIIGQLIIDHGVDLG